MEVKISKGIYISERVDWENFNYIMWNSIKNRETKNVIDRGKRCKTLNGVKPVENINKNPESFLETNPMQMEIPPSYSYTARKCIWVIESFLIKERSSITEKQPESSKINNW